MKQTEHSNKQMAGEPSRGGDKKRPHTDPDVAVTGMTEDTITDLLERLSSGRVDAAWCEFLARYSPLIMQVIRRHDDDYERAAECFIHVCGALSDDGFRRLLGFQPEGPARFRTWLMAVVSNLCVDWHRQQQGRIRPIRSVLRLPELDRQVYHCIYEKRMSRAQCLQAIQPRFPELTDAMVSEVNARLFRLLTPRQRWQLTVRTPARQPVTGGLSPEDDGPASRVAQPGPGPEELAAESQEQRRLRHALGRLPADQRLLLRLRYEQSLPLAEIARLTGQPDPFRVNRQVQAALRTLADLMATRMPGPIAKPAEGSV